MKIINFERKVANPETEHPHQRLSYELINADENNNISFEELALALDAFAKNSNGEFKWCIAEYDEQTSEYKILYGNHSFDDPFVAKKVTE